MNLKRVNPFSFRWAIQGAGRDIDPGSGVMVELHRGAIIQIAPREADRDEWLDISSNSWEILDWDGI